MNFRALLKGQIKHFREVPSSETTDFDSVVDYEFTLDDQLIAFEEVKKLYAALDKLEPLEREIVERYYILDQSVGEIACDSAKGYHQVARKKKKILKKLRALMM